MDANLSSSKAIPRAWDEPLPIPAQALSGDYDIQMEETSTMTNAYDEVAIDMNYHGEEPSTPQRMLAARRIELDDFKQEVRSQLGFLLAKHASSEDNSSSI